MAFEGYDAAWIPESQVKSRRLGTGRIANFNKIYRRFAQARAFVHTLKLKSPDEWQKYSKGQMPEKGMFPADIPANPNQTYKTENLLGGGVKEPRLGWEISLVNYPHTDCQRRDHKDDDAQDSPDSTIKPEGDRVTSFVLPEGEDS